MPNCTEYLRLAQDGGHHLYCKTYEAIMYKSLAMNLGEHNGSPFTIKTERRREMRTSDSSLGHGREKPTTMSPQMGSIQNPLRLQPLGWLKNGPEPCDSRWTWPFSWERQWRSATSQRGKRQQGQEMLAHLMHLLPPL